MTVGLVGHPQRHPQVGVRAQAVFDHAGGPLGGHHQVQAERPAALGDVDDAVDELRHLGGKGGELVDHQDQRRRRIRVGALLQRLEVLGALAVQQVLAEPQLGAERRERPAHEVRVEVGDQAHGVRQVDALGEGGAALVVHEQEGHSVRRVFRGDAHDPGLQEFALARPGRAADEGVRAVCAQVER